MSTKKKTAAGVAIAGAAAIAITGGTFATFSDSDSGSVSADAGSVVLTIGGSYQDGVHITDIAPGDGGTWTTTFTNDGSEAARLSLSDLSLKDYEHGLTSPETAAGDSSSHEGELSDMLLVNFDGITGGFVSLSEVASHAGSGIMTPTLDPGETYTLTTTVKFPNGGTGDENAAQTDGVDMDWTVTLEQA